MNSIKNLSTALAFVFAIGAAFAFKSAAPPDGIIDVEVKNESTSTCTPGTVDASCSPNNSNGFCLVDFKKVLPDGSSCSATNYLQWPS